ncbi:MAG: imidazole glycerol phosphate synthase subunit HisH, partial [Chlorobium sp.]|nr:imidazole glycerol phosphate synthase subunit HisH [Chlorobium sp.]
MMEKPKIAVIDYKMCNLFSVEHACRFAGGDPVITSDLDEIESADGVILPGVGAFKDAMENIRMIGIEKSIGKVIAKKRPFLGICLGF